MARTMCPLFVSRSHVVRRAWVEPIRLDDNPLLAACQLVDLACESLQQRSRRLGRRGVGKPVARPDQNECLDALFARRDPDVALAILCGDVAWHARAVAELGPETVDEEIDIAVGEVGALIGDDVEDLAAARKAVRILDEERSAAS